jgi:hypothetical protein
MVAERSWLFRWLAWTAGFQGRREGAEEKC